MAPSKQLLVALLLGMLVGYAQGIEGDVLAASDFRSGTQNWTLKGVGAATGWSSEGLQSEGDVIAAIDSPADTGKNWYYSAPKAFLGGDKSLAYNGWLVFDFGHFEYESMGMPAMAGYDVYLQAKSKKFTLGLKGVFQMDDHKLSNTYSVRLEEDFLPEGSTAVWELVNVVKAVDGKLVAKAPTQHEFITCLQTLTGIWIRGSYFKGSEASWLKDVKIIQGAVNKGGDPRGATSTLVNGSLVYGDKTAPPTASSTCCSSRTCVSNDKYEISFDRPGCMHSSDMYCCMAQDSCTAYSRTYDQSKAAEIVRGTDYNEGRAFFTPGTVDKCQGAGTGQHGAKFSNCHAGQPLPRASTANAVNDAATDLANDIIYMNKRAFWGTGTKNQNMGMQSIPVQKPFVKDYYMGSIPRICSAATLTIEAEGDLADAKDHIMVYGEDDVYLGTIFAGNLTYMKEGQRAYDAYGPNTDCDGTYDSNIAGSGENARLADPHHPTGNRPQHKGYRGGRNDVVTPGVQGNEDTRCSRWVQNGKQPLSFQHSDSVPYIDSIAISQDRMMQYSADSQIKFTFRSVRDDAAANTFSGTGGGGSTRHCNFDTTSAACGAGVKCEGCDLDGKVIFRSIKLKFSAGVCFTKAAATDYGFEYFPQIHTPQNLNISVTYSVPSGDTGSPGGDAAFSVTAGADIFGSDKKLVVFDKDLNKVGELFARESFQSLRTHMSDDSMVMTTSFGAKDSPTPFHVKTNCDTTSPILGMDRCTQPDNQWSMKDTLINYTDTLRIPRETIAKMAVNGKVQLYITADVPANAFSLSSEGRARFSPITLAYPLMHCFMKAIKTGPNFGIFLDRPMSYYFKETGFPMPAGDVTVFVAASWQQHVRYVTRHVGAAVGNKFAYDGVEDGLPVMRVDKDTVGDMGAVWVYKNTDGQECCPSAHKPTAADGMHQVAAYSNCIGKLGMCVDPALSTYDTCTEENPCPTATTVNTGTTIRILEVEASAVEATMHIYVGMKVILYVALKGPIAAVSTSVLVTPGAGCTIAGIYTLRIVNAPGGSGGGAACRAIADSNGAITAAEVACSALGAYTLPPLVTLYDLSHPLMVNLAACATVPVFTALLEPSPALDALGTVSAGGNVRTIVSYDGDNRFITLDADLGGVPVNGKNFFRISADLGEDIRTNVALAALTPPKPPAATFARNQRDGGTSTGTVAVPLASTVTCQTRLLKSGVLENYDAGLTTTTLRLDDQASLFDTAYNGYKIRVKRSSNSLTYANLANSWQVLTILTYTGTVQGRVSARGAFNELAPTLMEAVTITLQLAAVEEAVKGDFLGNAGVVVPATAVTQGLVSTDHFYNGAIIEIDIDGDESTSDDIYTRKIAGYTGATGTVTIKIPLIKKTVASGTAGLDNTAAITRIVLAASADSDVSGSDDAYNGMYILIDNDGYPGTQNDIEFVQISDYVGTTRVATVGSIVQPTVHSTWTIIEKLTDLDFPQFVSNTQASTFRIYNRDATVGTPLAVVLQTKDIAPANDKAIAAATVGTTSITFVGTTSTSDDDYNDMKVRVTEYGVIDEYTITDYKGGTKTATVSPALVRSYTATATYEIFRVYEIYQDLGTECLQNVNMTVTYTYGTARETSNDPGELSTIYSNWDRELVRATGWAALPQQRDVRAWTLKLAGAGYYNELYPGQGMSSYDNNVNKASGTQVATTAQPATATATTLSITTSNAGIQVGQMLKITDLGMVTVSNSQIKEQFEIVKVTAITSATDIVVLRAQMGTLAATFSAATLAVYTVGFNQGQGMDEMAELGGQARYSSALNSAYTGLFVTIVAGTGAGQTRWINDYHGDSRTVFVGGSPWSTIPDATSKYKIYYSAEITEYKSTATGNLAIATYPRPVKKGYLIEIHWHKCAADIPESFLNNAWTETFVSNKWVRTLNKNYKPSQTRDGLPECRGQLGMRKPKQGPATVYSRFKVLETDYATGVVKAVDGTYLQFTLDKHARTEAGFYVGRKIIFKSPAGTMRGTATIMQSWLGGVDAQRFTNVIVDSAISAASGANADAHVNDIYTITPAEGTSGSTTISEDGQNGEQYTVEEVDVVRYEYPELIAQHREWPHGYSYLQMKAGEDGEHIGNLFLKDYTQYSTESYYTDSITIPRSVFENYVKGQPNGVSGEFPFTFKTPPGKGNIELLSVVIGYPVLKEEDASSYDSTDIETKRTSSHGPPPFFPYSSGWSGVDESSRTSRTHPRFQTHSYTSTCGNGVHDAGEYCDDGNQNDGDGCSSSCALEAGWVCETVSLQSPSICRKGLVGSRVPDQEVGCKAYACEAPAVNTNDALGPVIVSTDVTTWTTLRGAEAIICSGTPTDGLVKYYGTGGVTSTTLGGDANGLAVNTYGPHFPICKFGTFQGTCSLCINWDNSDTAPPATVTGTTILGGGASGTQGGILGDSGVAGFDGSSKRRLLVDTDAAPTEDAESQVTI